MVVDSELLNSLKILVSNDEVVRLRRLVAEEGQTPYSDDVLKETIALHPLTDREEVEPFNTYTFDLNSTWIPTWDLYYAAADIWTEKAANVACKVSFKADGVDVQRSDLHKHYLAQARYYMSRRVASSVPLVAQDRVGKKDSFVVANLIGD